MSAPTALVMCGALGREVKEIVDRRGWDVDMYGVSALLHLYPSRIVDELRVKLYELRPRYEKLVVVYGDCGTTGKLEPLLEEVGASRLRGPHCYEMFAGEERFRMVSDDKPGTFFLTDWLMYLRQLPNPRLAEKANQIAAYLGLPLEIVDVGLGELEDRLAELVEA
jgi:hypothetical protein